ncbi:hypothetical protein MKW92_038316, partial [Papaver armeniacum]
FWFFLVTRLIKHSKSDTMVLAGLNGSDKTVLFYQLRDGSAHQGTVTSMVPNEENFVLRFDSSKKGKIKHVRVVDVPGHSLLGPKPDEYLPQAMWPYFVVDALDFVPNFHVAAEYLYEILTNAPIVKKRIRLLIMCNKSDKMPIPRNSSENNTFTVSQCHNKVSVGESSGLTGDKSQVEHFIRENVY